VIRYVTSERQGYDYEVIEEMESIASEGERQTFAELTSRCPEGAGKSPVHFLWHLPGCCERLQVHPSAGASLKNIKLERCIISDLCEVLNEVSEKLK